MGLRVEEGSWDHSQLSAGRFVLLGTNGWDPTIGQKGGCIGMGGSLGRLEIQTENGMETAGIKGAMGLSVYTSGCLLGKEGMDKKMEPTAT